MKKIKDRNEVMHFRLIIISKLPFIFLSIMILAAFITGCAGVAKDTKVKCPKCGAVFAVEEGSQEMEKLPGSAKPNGPKKGNGGSEKIPEFPWPPPEASAREIIPNQLLLKADAQKTCLSDIDKKLSDALRSCGYSEISYFSVPAGFAMVSRLEQINDDGTPKEIPDRWAKEVLPVDSISLRKILRALFTANPGYYRLIVFIVTPTPFSDVGAKVNREEAETWLHRGLNVQPPSIGKIEYTNETVCTALIYEFEQLAAGKQAVIKLPGRLTGEIHLRKNNLLQILER